MVEGLSVWPNFFIAGAPKAGTTSLYYYLAQHPEIFMSRVKEPDFFHSPEFRKTIFSQKISSEEDYLKLFNNVKNEKIVGEASGLYLLDPKSPILIHQKIPDAYILISLRDPVESVFSIYWMRKRSGDSKFTFSAEIEKKMKRESGTDFNYIDIPIYYENVRRYLDIFKKNHVKVIIFEEFVEDTKNTIKDISNFLGIEKDYEFKQEQHNPFRIQRNSLTHSIMKTIGRKMFVQKYISNEIRELVADTFLYKKAEKPKMDEQTKRKLIEFYQDDVKKVQTLFEKKAPLAKFSRLIFDIKWPIKPSIISEKDLSYEPYN